MSYLITAVLIGGVILIHEIGHLLMAKCGNIPIQRFSVGFGPRLFGFQRRGTEYCVSLIPLGGYVLPKVESHDDFSRLPLGGRILFCLGGPVFNLLGAMLCLTVVNGLESRFTIPSAMASSLSQTLALVQHMVMSIPELFSHPEKLSGIVGIVAAGGRHADAGVAWAVSFWVLLSVNLAVFNLLPVPPLDGGKILFFMLEALWKPLKRLQAPVAVAGWVLMLTLMAYLTVQDIGRLVVSS